MTVMNVMTVISIMTVIADCRQVTVVKIGFYAECMVNWNNHYSFFLFFFVCFKDRSHCFCDDARARVVDLLPWGVFLRSAKNSSSIGNKSAVRVHLPIAVRVQVVLPLSINIIVKT